jgi:hypothetical protein
MVAEMDNGKVVVRNGDKDGIRQWRWQVATVRWMTGTEVVLDNGDGDGGGRWRGR